MRYVRIAALAGALVAALLLVDRAWASRNSAGTMAAANGPYVTNTVINSTLLNARLADIESELTNSLDRNGKGGMLAALRGTDGTVAAPALSFTSETGTGLYRIGAGDLGIAILGSKVGEWTANGLRAANGAVATPSLSFVNDTGDGLYRIGANNPGFAVAGSKRQEWTTTGTIVTGTASVTSTLGVTGVTTTTGGLVIGSSGTAISKSVRATGTWNPGLLAACGAGPCVTVTTNLTVTGAATGADCIAGVVNPAPLSGYPVQCIVTAADTCGLMIVNQTNTAVTFGSATFYCRVFNP